MTGLADDVIIRAERVHKTYRATGLTVHALRGIDLEVRRGEMAAVMGPSGCGKTTLLNCLSGLDSIDGGRVLIAGDSLQDMSDDALSEFRARSMGFVFQLFNLLPVLTAQENVELPLLVSGENARAARAAAREQLDQVGLLDRAHHLPAELSGGQRQRVAIARALVNRPAIVWADEPTGNLDSENAADVMDLLCHLNEQNRQTFLIVTHAPEVGARANRIIRMRDGLIEDDGLDLVPAARTAAGG